VFGAVPPEERHTQVEPVEDAEDPQQEDARGPDQEVGADTGAREQTPADGPIDGAELALRQEFVDRLLGLRDRHGHHRPQHRDRLKQGLGDVVVGGPDEALSVQRAGREGHHGRADDPREPSPQTATDDVCWKDRQRPEDGWGEQHDQSDLCLAGIAQAHDQGPSGDQLVEQRPELGVRGADGEVRPRIEGHRGRPVVDGVLDRSEVIEGVVAAVQRCPSGSEPLPVEGAGEEGESEQEGEREVVVVVGEPPPDDGEPFLVVQPLTPGTH